MTTEKKRTSWMGLVEASVAQYIADEHAELQRVLASWEKYASTLSTLLTYPRAITKEGSINDERRP